MVHFHSYTESKKLYRFYCQNGSLNRRRKLALNTYITSVWECVAVLLLCNIRRTISFLFLQACTSQKISCSALLRNRKLTCVKLDILCIFFSLKCFSDFSPGNNTVWQPNETSAFLRDSITIYFTKHSLFQFSIGKI